MFLEKLYERKISVIGNFIAVFVILSIIKIIFHLIYLVREDQVMGRIPQYNFLTAYIRYFIILTPVFVVNKLAMQRHSKSLELLRKINVAIQILLGFNILVIVVLALM